MRTSISNGHDLPDRERLSEVYSLIRPFRLGIVGLILISSCTSAAGLLPPYLVKIIIDDAIPSGSSSTILVTAGLLLLSFLLISIISFFEGYLATAVSLRVGKRLRQHMYTALSRRSLENIRRLDKGRLSNRFMQDIVTIQRGIVSSIPNATRSIVTISGTLLIILTVDMGIGLFLLCMVPLYILVSSYIAKHAKDLEEKARLQGDEISQHALESFDPGGVVFLRSVSGATKKKEDFQRAIDANVDNRLRIAIAMRLQSAAFTMIGGMTLFLIYYVGGIRFNAGEITIGIIVALAAYAVRIFEPVRSLSTIRIGFVASQVSLMRIKDVLGSNEISVQPPAKVDLPIRQTEPASVTVSSLYFKYNDTSRSESWLIEDVNFDIPSGALALVTGSSGSGKSTLVQLIAGLHEPDRGDVRVNDRSIFDVDMSSRFEHVCYVAEQPFFFSGTVRDNLALARPDGTVAEFIEALKQANLYEELREQGITLDSDIQENASQLSSGQRKRLSMARAALTKAPVLILDEPTANLDHENQAHICRVIRQLNETRTVIVSCPTKIDGLSADVVIPLHSTVEETPFSFGTAAWEKA